MPSESQDIGLKVLMDLHNAASASVEVSLLRTCYQIQRQYQFDRDREIPLDLMRRSVQEAVSEQLKSQAGEGTVQ